MRFISKQPIYCSVQLNLDTVQEVPHDQVFSCDRGTKRVAFWNEHRIRPSGDHVGGIPHNLYQMPQDFGT